MAGIEFLAITMKKRCIAEFWKKKRKWYIERGEWRKNSLKKKKKNEEERERERKALKNVMVLFFPSLSFGSMSCSIIIILDWIGLVFHPNLLPTLSLCHHLRNHGLYLV